MRCASPCRWTPVVWITSHLTRLRVRENYSHMSMSSLESLLRVDLSLSLIVPGSEEVAA